MIQSKVNWDVISKKYDSQEWRDEVTIVARLVNDALEKLSEYDKYHRSLVSHIPDSKYAKYKEVRNIITFAIQEQIRDYKSRLPALSAKIDAEDREELKKQGRL